MTDIVQIRDYRPSNRQKPSTIQNVWAVRHDRELAIKESERSWPIELIHRIRKSFIHQSSQARLAKELSGLSDHLRRDIGIVDVAQKKSISDIPRSRDWLAGAETNVRHWL